MPFFQRVSLSLLTRSVFWRANISKFPHGHFASLWLRVRGSQLVPAAVISEETAPCWPDHTTEQPSIKTTPFSSGDGEKDICSKACKMALFMKTVSQNCSIYHPYTVKKNYCNFKCKTVKHSKILFNIHRLCYCGGFQYMLKVAFNTVALIIQQKRAAGLSSLNNLISWQFVHIFLSG